MATRKNKSTSSRSPVVVRKMALGRGVFAKRQIERTTLLGPVEGKVVDDPDFGSDYCMDLGGTLSLEPKRPFRFLNHSCDPNCLLVLMDEPDAEHGRVIMVETLREIDKDEELTIDYSWPVESAIPCQCQSEQCRGWIVDPALMDELLAYQEAEASELESSEC